MERELRIPAPFARREKGPREYVPAPTGLKIDLKTETAAQPVFEAITLRTELWSPKNLFQKAEHKGCCKSTSHSKNAIINALHDFFDLTLSLNR
jgi:hypothetical protein